ncbi:MAG: NADH:flavin oxidoreductase [Deltaproteobacteria bacterium]|nr:NADH:flavin oxidoreductase [Deltaproteobacteria bacterium]
MNEKIFDPAVLAGMQLKNRILRSATHEGMSDETGSPTENLKKLYVRLAKGGAGAIITGFAGIQSNGKGHLFGMSMIDSDDLIPAYREIVDAVHEYNTPIIMQIAHCGRQTRSKTTGLQTVAPSALRDAFFSEDMPRELSDEEINELIDNFVKSIVRAKKAGFDGVQLHAAHGYLLSEFLSSHSNRRKDRWGGSTENKYRLIGEIFKRATNVIGDYPILVKLNAYDGRKSGMKPDEAVRIAMMLEASGCAAIEVSCGIVEDGLYSIRGEELPVDAAMEYNFKYKNLPSPVKTIVKPILKRVMKQPKPLLKFNLDSALQIKKAVAIPVIVVGGINNIGDIDDIVANKGIDFVSMCRPFIIEPDIANKFNKGIQSASKCILCNYCTILTEAKPLRCYYGKLPNIGKD